MRLVWPIALVATLAACASPEPLRYAVEPAASATTERVRISARTVSVVEVSLPAYAKEAKIFVEREGEALQALENADWGDDPARAMTTTLVASLIRLTGAQVASEPWPLGGVPDAELRVRVSDMLVRADGVLSLSGTYTIRRDEARSRNRIELFSLDVPVASTAPADIVDAHAAAWRELAIVLAKALR